MYDQDLREPSINPRKGLKRNERDRAEIAFEALRAMPSIEPRRGMPSAGFPISQALLHVLEKDVPKPGKDYGRRRTRHLGNASMVMILLPFWGARTIGEGGEEAGDAYDSHRQAVMTKAGSPNGRKAEKNFLRKAVTRFINDHKLVGAFDLPDTTEVEPYARTRISRDGLARLLWAARGRRWDAENNRWKPCPPWDLENPNAIKDDPAWKTILWLKRERRHTARTIIIEAYTTAPASCVTRLRWAGDPEGSESFVDLDDVHHKRKPGDKVPAVPEPKIYRLGPDAGRGKHAGKPALLCRRVTVHLRRWRAMDEAIGCQGPIHYRGKPLVYAPTQSFEAIVLDAGLPERLRIDDLRYSAGAHIAKKKGMMLRSAALLMGVSTSYYKGVYGHLADNYQDRIRDAFSMKPGKPIDTKA